MTPDAPKDDILPALISAEQNGVFKQPPKLPEYLAKASGDRDWMSKALPEMNPNNRKHLMKLASEHNVSVPFGAKTEEYQRLLREAGVL